MMLTIRRTPLGGQVSLWAERIVAAEPTEDVCDARLQLDALLAADGVGEGASVQVVTPEGQTLHVCRMFTGWATVTRVSRTYDLAPKPEGGERGGRR